MNKMFIVVLEDCGETTLRINAFLKAAGRGDVYTTFSFHAVCTFAFHQNEMFITKKRTQRIT